MAAATHPGGGRPGQPAKKKTVELSTWVAVLISIVVCGGFILLGVFRGDPDGTTVPPPAADERAQTVPILAQAASSQGICYGWRLERLYGATISVGSNLGDGAAVGEAPGCPRWVEVRARVKYTPESSESSDTALVDVQGSADIDHADLAAMESGLERFGLDSDTFVDDPGWAVCRAAVALPLLAAEAGLAPPAAPLSVDPAASVAPLPDAGSDFWRDRWGWLFATAGVLLLAALLCTVGLVKLVRQRRAPAPAGRTQGKA